MVVVAAAVLGLCFTKFTQHCAKLEAQYQHRSFILEKKKIDRIPAFKGARNIAEMMDILAIQGSEHRAREILVVAWVGREPAFLPVPPRFLHGTCLLS